MKHRRVTDSPSGKEPVKDMRAWDDRQRDWDRERMRDRKLGGSSVGGSTSYDYNRTDSRYQREMDYSSRSEPPPPPMDPPRGYPTQGRIDQSDPRLTSRPDNFSNGSHTGNSPLVRMYSGDTRSKPLPLPYGVNPSNGAIPAPPIVWNSYNNPGPSQSVPPPPPQPNMASLMSNSSFNSFGVQNPSSYISPRKNIDIDQDPRRRDWKIFSSKVVVNKMTQHFKNGEIAKGDFKLLCKKIVDSLIDKEHTRGYVCDRESEARVKSYIDPFFQRYLEYKRKNNSKVEQWLQSQEES